MQPEGLQKYDKGGLFMGTNRGKRTRTQTLTGGLTDAQGMSFIDGYNFWYGPDYGPEGAFLTEDHKKVMWQECRKELVALIEREAEQNAQGYWHYRGSYLPYGPRIESIDAYWRYDLKKPMQWPQDK